MGSTGVLPLVVLACLASAGPATAEYVNYLMIAPQNPLLQIGTNFTAMCWVKNTTEVTAEDLIWTLANNVIPKEQYTTINSSALNVTITVTSETPQWLFCSCKKDSLHVKLNNYRYHHGIRLRKGYRPRKPENLTCMVRQEQMDISKIMHCEWEPRQQQRGDFKTIYTLNVNVISTSENFKKTTEESSAAVEMNIFPNFMMLEIWVEAVNELGKEESEHLKMEAGSFVKTNPPSDINIISEKGFPTSLLIRWTQPIDNLRLSLIFEIRFTTNGSHTWSCVPPADIKTNIQSFRLQELRPDTVYVIQVRCKNVKEGYWSDWSGSSTKRTPTSKPSSEPDLWQIIETERADKQRVQLLSKEPEFANGKIKGFEIKVQGLKDLENRSAEWESIPITNPDADSNSQHITLLKQIYLSDTIPVKVKVTAFNSDGKSPEANLVIQKNENVNISVQDLKVYPNNGKLHVEWTASNNTGISEYVVEWASGSQIDWQREPNNIRKTIIRGNIKSFVRYNLSVYPLKSGWIGNPARVETYLEQGEKLAQAKEENLEMHQVLDQTLMELNNL